MFVCICNAITDHQIKETVAAGANTLDDLQAQLGVATCCGCCKDLASSFLSANSVQAQSHNISAGIRVSQ
ncbi:MAG: (2Fe-2S)-binding protein [Neisseria sp.]|nr:(2Fe-2S)-binding protein [Neisseria sp.]